MRVCYTKDEIYDARDRQNSKFHNAVKFVDQHIYFSHIYRDQSNGRDAGVDRPSSGRFSFHYTGSHLSQC